MKSGVELIAEERTRQITGEGYSAAHDDAHDAAELIKAAAVYLAIGRILALRLGISEWEYPACRGLLMSDWPWEESKFKPSVNPIRNLIKAGALIAAEIDRLNRRGFWSL